MMNKDTYIANNKINSNQLLTPSLIDNVYNNKRTALSAPRLQSGEELTGGLPLQQSAGKLQQIASQDKRNYELDTNYQQN